MNVELYGLASCDTCGKARRWLKRFGHAYDFVDLVAARPDADTLHAWAAAAGGWEALVNRSGAAWQRLLPARRHPAGDPEWSMQGAFTRCLEWHRVCRHRVRQDAERRMLQGWLLATDGRISLGFSGGEYEKRFGKS